MPASYRARIEQMRPQFEAMAKEQYGVTINAGPFGIESRLALVAAKVAEAKGVGAAFHEAVFRAYWEKGHSIAEPDKLLDIATELGLDRHDFEAALNDDTWEQAVQADIEQAQQYGLNSVPALVFNNKYLVSGAQPYDVLQQVAERIRAEAVVA